MIDAKEYVDNLGVAKPKEEEPQNITLSGDILTDEISTPDLLGRMARDRTFADLIKSVGITSKDLEGPEIKLSILFKLIVAYYEKYPDEPSIPVEHLFELYQEHLATQFMSTKEREANLELVRMLLTQMYEVDMTSGNAHTKFKLLEWVKNLRFEKLIRVAMKELDPDKKAKILAEGIARIQQIGAEPDEVEGIGMIEILGKKLEEPTYLIKPFMEPGEKGYLAAKYKVGKTFLEMQMAICLAKGIPFLGFEVPEARKVLYIRFELTDYKFQQRLHKMSRYEIHTPIKKEPWFILRKGFNLISQVDLDWLFRQIDKHEPDLLIFDPLYKLTNLNLADPKSAPPLLGAYAKIQQKYPRLAINLAHHMVKSGDEDSWDSTYGPMQFFADMDYEMRLRKDGKGRFILDFLSNAESVDKIELERDSDSLIYRVINESSGQKKAREDDEKLSKMSEILKSEYEKYHKPITQKTFQGLCKEEKLKVGRELFDRLSREGSERGYWEVEEKGKYQLYSPCDQKAQSW